MTKKKKSGASNGAKKVNSFDEQKTSDAAGKKPYHYREQYPEAGRRTTEGQRQMKERLKHGDMHLHYGFEDTPEGKAKYQKAKKEYDLY